MELKKSPKANIEKQKNTFLLFGLVLSLGIVFGAFQWNSNPSRSSLGVIEYDFVDEDMIPPTSPYQTPPPPPPPKVIDMLVIVDNTVEIDNHLDFISSEATDDTFIDVTPFMRALAKEDEDNTNDFIFIAEEMPLFPGGESSLRNYIAQAIRYPQIAQENGVQGRVYVQFIVDRDGSVTQATIARGVDPSLDREALRVINSLPKWQPGLQGGKPVRVMFTVPISFQLQ